MNLSITNTNVRRHSSLPVATQHIRDTSDNSRHSAVWWTGL